MIKKIFLIVLFCLIIINLNSITSFQQSNISYLKSNINNINFADDKVIVVLKNDPLINYKTYTEYDFNEIDCNNVTEISYDSEKRDEKCNKILCIELENSSKSYVIEAIEKLNNRSDVLYSEPNYILNNQFDPNIPTTGTNDGQWFIDELNLIQCWNITTGSSEVKVGIIDSGINGSHPKLTNSIDTQLSKDFTVSNSEDSTALIDTYGHGTHVAGIIAADYNENNHTSGITPNIQLVSLKVTNNIYIDSSYFISAIKYADFKNIKILNFSGGWLENYIDYRLLEEVISEYKGIFICSSGNNGHNIDTQLFYPACLNLNNIICVGAIARDGSRWVNNNIDNQLLGNYSSNYGQQNVDIYAIGENVYSTNSDSYSYKSGTSMAAPIVTGLCAMLMSINSNLSINDLKNLILDNAIDHEMTLNNLDSNSESMNVKKINILGSVKALLEQNISNNSFILNENLYYETVIENNGSNFHDKNRILKINVNNLNLYDILITSDLNINVFILDENLNLIDIHTHTNSASDLTKIYLNLSLGTYYIIVCSDNNVENNYIEMNVQLHNHEYCCRYLWNNNRMHKKLCCCNTFQTEGHAVIQGTNKCILCNGLAEIGFSSGIGIMNEITLRSKNGSYILSNGVIVLVNEDVNSYLQGTLLFYDLNNPEVK